MTNEEKIVEINQYGRAARGRQELIKFYSGKRLTQRQAIAAYCYQCMSYYADGKGDCGDKDCPLHQYMPYTDTQ